MIKTKHLLIIFIPAVLVALFGIFIAITQYEPLYPEEKASAAADDSLFHIPIRDADPILGDKKAPNTLIAFEDFGCDHCKTLDAVFQELLEKYPKKVKIIWKGLAVTQFPFNTKRAHAYAYCAGEQKKFDAFKELAFQNNDNLSEQTLIAIAKNITLDDVQLSECLASGAAEAHGADGESLAALLNIQAVPAIFFHDVQITPPSTLSGWEALLGLESQ